MFDCADTPISVPRALMQQVVRVESSGNPYAIGVVGGRLQRQPRNLLEAVATARMLAQKGYNFSLGLAQINRYNLKKYGLNTYQQAFATCKNVEVGSRILRECQSRANDWGKALSCYYSGNFTTGFKHGYVQKVLGTKYAQSSATPSPLAPRNAIPVIPRVARKKSRASRKVVGLPPSTAARLRGHDESALMNMGSTLSAPTTVVPAKKAGTAATKQQPAPTALPNANAAQQPPATKPSKVRDSSFVF